MTFIDEKIATYLCKDEKMNAKKEAPHGTSFHRNDFLSVISCLLRLSLPLQQQPAPVSQPG
jgi:hypothetical protein